MQAKDENSNEREEKEESEEEEEVEEEEEDDITTDDETDLKKGWYKFFYIYLPYGIWNLCIQIHIKYMYSRFNIDLCNTWYHS